MLYLVKIHLLTGVYLDTNTRMSYIAITHKHIIIYTLLNMLQGEMKLLVLF